ncbi:MAG: tyrosine-type recombinase/integrase [Candidatus Omnitrophota bacterium]
MRVFVAYLRQWLQIKEPQLKDFNETNIRQFLIDRLKSGITPRTNLTNWQALKAFSKFLLRREYIGKDPMLNVIRPQVEKKLPEALDEKQVKELMRYMMSRRKPRYRIAYLRDLALVGVFVFAGLRRSEALNLKIKDIDLNNNALRLMHTKTRRQEVVPICSTLKQLLMNYLQVRMTLKRETDNLFVDSNRSGQDKRRGDGSFGTRGLQLLFGELNNNLSFGKKLRPHLLRRSFATMLLRKGLNIVDVSRLLRHSDISVTVKSYIGYDEGELLKSLEKFHPLSLKF